MFDLKFVQKAQKEFRQSLIKEFQKIEKDLNTKEILTFNKYLQENSLSGMNIWLQSYSELKYFIEILKELKNTKDVFYFQKEICENLIHDFGEEDFRFLEWERNKPIKKDLQKIVERWVKEAKTKLLKYDNTYSLSEDSIRFYYKTNKEPYKIGANVKFILCKTPKEKVEQLKIAEEELQKFFPYGFSLYKLLTQKIIIVRSNDLVSYSFFHEPGISYINVIDRNLLQTIDDLVHENAHHHLNLILRKYKILQKNSKKVFFSPWRKELRGIYAILHAVFTFSFGAKLFLAIVNEWNKFPTKLKKTDFEISCLRFVEETLMLEYSLEDLNKNLDSFTEKGLRLISTLNSWNMENKKFLNQIKKQIKREKFLKQISNLQKHLRKAREEYSIYSLG